MCPKIPNSTLIFHNKLPKSGSTTFFKLLTELKKTNDFDLAHLIPCFDANDPHFLQEDNYFRKNRPDWDPAQCTHTLQVRRCLFRNTVSVAKLKIQIYNTF